LTIPKRDGIKRVQFPARKVISPHNTIATRLRHTFQKPCVALSPRD
jgi:hypothetical protein